MSSVKSDAIPTAICIVMAIRRAHNRSGYPVGTGQSQSMPMRANFWNMRGFSNVVHRAQVKKVVQWDHVDITGLHETIKEDFS